ncbi:MAG: outer membrane protein assembly factor BamA [Gemmatimonadota bacterium]|nr:outer membrane protein assembly factor BamA [Gemmatimonadota bacterium]
MRGSLVRAFFAVAIALSVAVPAAAQQAAAPDTITALRERGCCLDEVTDGAVVEEVDVRGNEALTDQTIENAIWTTESGGFLGFLPWFGTERHLDKSEFLKDLTRIHVLYQRHGYFDIRLDSYSIRRSGDDGVEVRFTVSEGEPTRVDTLRIEWLEEVENVPRGEDLREHLPLKEGEIFNEQNLQASRDTLETMLKNRGYAFAQVLLEYRIRKDERRASVAYSAAPGDVYYIGDVAIRGYDEADDDLIRRQLRFDRGDRYDREDILTSQRRIYELALFRQVEISPQLDSVRGDTVDVQVSVTPAPTHLVRVGVGYGTEDLFRARASWLDRNLLGESRQLEVRGIYSQLEREAAVTYRQPFVFVPGLNYMASAFLRFEVEPNYTVERTGATTRWGYRVSPRIHTRWALTAERDDFSDFDEGALIPELGREFVNPSRLLYMDLGVSWDSTDSLFRPTRGYTANAAYQIAFPVLTSDYAYHKLSVELTHYRQVKEGWVVALKLLPGAIFTYSGDPETGGEGRVPLFQRLFAGGATSVRGYGRRQLGPKIDPDEPDAGEDPEPIGGNALLETSVELRFPIRGNFRGAAFVDAGNVWSEVGDWSPGELEYTPGVGVRYATPVGPVRLDVARKLDNDEDFLPSWVFHISIGNAF